MSMKDLNKASELLDQSLLAALRKMKQDDKYNAAILREIRQRLKDLNIGVAMTGDTDAEKLAEEYGLNDENVIKLPGIDMNEDDAATG